MTKHYKTLPLTLEVDGHKGFVKGYASVFGVTDRHQDQVMPGAFLKTLKQWALSGDKPKMLWSHNFEAPVGTWTTMREDAKGLYVEGKIELGVQKGREVYALLKSGAIDGLSIGYKVIKSKKDQAKGITALLDVELFEVSFVTLGSNPKARVMGVKGFDAGQAGEGAFQNEMQVNREEKREISMHTKNPFYRSGASASGLVASEHQKAFHSYLKKGAEFDLQQFETKALSVGSETDGGYFVPREVSDHLLRQLKSHSVMRSVATRMDVNTDALEMLVEDSGFAAGWAGETDGRDETESAKLKKVRIPVFEQYAEPRVTQKLLDDADLDVEAWMVERVADKLSASEEAAFFNGDGEKQPRGILTYEHGTEFGQIERVKTGKNGGFSDDIGVELLVEAVCSMKQHYLKDACWIMSRSALALVKGLKDGSGRYVFEPAAGLSRNPTLLGYPVHISEHMPAVGDGSLSIAFGSFKDAYTIVDRQGMRVIRDNLTQKPFVKFYTTKRVGGDVVNFDALKLFEFSEA